MTRELNITRIVCDYRNVDVGNDDKGITVKQVRSLFSYAADNLVQELPAGLAKERYIEMRVRRFIDRSNREVE